ncbi:beta-1,3-galactosyltransferase 5 [Bacillus rossius redtenbacheri]|uniref:beta-1,3-galactosyltransferase 5 n=1 Tax=Bacillus rossius redtenbacheri TaxID=93214 RepID=UPI002FDD62DC
MLEKRRHGAASLASPLLAAALTAAACLSLWQLSRCPAAPAAPLVAPAYLLLLPGNATSLPSPYPLHRLPAGDPGRLVDLPFAFRLNNYPCNESAPLLLVLVHSAPANADKRRAIRDTWGARRDALRLLFLLGEVDSGAAQLALEREDLAHGDLVQGSFRDSYRNMTYKHVMSLKWTAYFCPGARYLLKTDDDVFVNTPALLDFLSQELSPWGARRLIMCAPFPRSFVKRSYRSKWRVSPAEYPSRVYPPYCAGWAVLYSPDVVFLLYREAQRARYFWIDDVHVTGTLASRANLTQTDVGSLALTPDQVSAVEQSGSLAAVGRFLFGAPNLELATLYRLWGAVSGES